MKVNPILEELKEEIIGRLEAISNQGQVTPPEISSALNRARDLSFPGSRQEEWKYSPFSVAKDTRFTLAQNHRKVALSLKNNGFEDCMQLVFVDGQYEPALSDHAEIKGLSIKPLANVAQPFESRIPGFEDNIFDHLNLASALWGGIEVIIQPGCVVEKPIVFVHHFSGDGEARWVQPRIHIRVEKQAEVAIAEVWETTEKQTYVANAVSEIHVADRAHVKWINLEVGSPNSSIINQTRVEIQGNGVFQHHVVSFGEGYIRNNLEIKINGKEGDAHMYGLSLGNGKFHVDHHTFVNHKAENTTSNQLYKTILAGKSNGVFNGKILVDQKAQKTNAYQSSKNILLSADAKVNAKPQLEIFADDVKCSHGATIGQLDEEPVFYLRSRGLDEATAKQLLIQAFAAEIFEKIHIPTLKKWIGEKVEAYMNTMLQPS